MVLDALNIRGFLFRCEYRKISCGKDSVHVTKELAGNHLTKTTQLRKTLQGDGTRLEGQVVNDISCHYALQYNL
jgi:hypothetical protein